MSRGTEPDLEKGPPQGPRPAGEKPQRQGGGFTRPVYDTDLETGTPPYKYSSLLREGPLEVSESTDSGCYDDGSSSSLTNSLPDSGGQESSGPRPGAVDGPGSEGQRGERPLLGQGDRKDSGLGLHQNSKRGEDAESEGELLLWRESPGRKEALREGAEAESGEGLLPGYGDRRGSRGLHTDTERGEDAESGGEMLLGRESQGKREALKKGSGTEQTSLVRRRGPEGSTQTPPGEEENRERKRLPSEVTLSSGKLLVLLCAVCAFSLLMVLTICALTGRFSTQDIPVPAHLEPCPMNWLHSRNKCYYFSTMYKEEGDWDESQRFCSSHNGTLALFDNEDQLNFLMDISSGHHMWVGLQKRQNGIYWANGTACSCSLCSITDFGECAFIAVRALYMSSCGLPRPYICSKEPYV